VLLWIYPKRYKGKQMARKIALFILYNHNYTENIDRTEKLYEGKFTYVYHLIPFYIGDRQNVIAVYESSIRFNSYISQAFQKVKKEGFSHYFVVADDMIINPSINENNLFEFTGIEKDSSFITDIRDYSSCPYDVPLFEKICGWGIEVMNILPPKDKAVQIYVRNGLNVMPNKVFAIKYFLHYMLRLDYKKCIHAIYYLLRKDKPFIYPALWAYSDIILLPNEYMEDFATYSGAFAGLNIFVEQAIPLAIYLSSKKVTLGNQIKLKSISQLYTLGENGQIEFEKKYDSSLEKLIHEYPDDLFFVHPIKLSKWK